MKRYDEQEEMERWQSSIDSFFSIFTPLLIAAGVTAAIMFAKREPWRVELSPNRPYWEARGERASYKLYPLRSDTLSDWYPSAEYPVDSRLEVEGINGWEPISVRWDSIRYGTRAGYWKAFPVVKLARGGYVKEDSTYFFRVTENTDAPPHVRPVIRQIREIGGAI